MTEFTVASQLRLLCNPAPELLPQMTLRPKKGIPVTVQARYPAG